MLKKWRKLDELDCIKMYGHNHKMAHIIGTHSRSKCVGTIGAVAIAEGLAHGISQPCPDCRKGEVMTYQVFFKVGMIEVENVEFMNFDGGEIILRDANSVILCVVNKLEYECIVKKD